MIKEKVSSIIDYYQTRDPFLLCEEMGILVIDLDLPESVNGIYTMVHGQNTIILNNTLSRKRRISVCAHELGHVILHGNLNCLDLEHNTNFKVSRFETEADTFAAYLLIDEDYVENEIFSDGTPTAVSDIAARLGLPEYMVRLRFNV